MKRPKQAIQVFFETSHGKSMSDGLGGVVQWYVSQGVTVKIMIRNGKKLFDYCEKTLAVVGDKMNGKMVNRVFMYISAMDMKEYREEFYEKCKLHKKCKQIIGMHELHQVLTNLGR